VVLHFSLRVFHFFKGGKKLNNLKLKIVA